MRLTRRQAFLVAAVIAVIVAALVYVVLSKQTGAPEPTEPQMVTVLVAERAIAPFTTITADMLGTREVDSRAAPSGALTEPEQAIGKISQGPIISGQTLTGADVGVRSAEQGLTFVIEEGMRAVTVALDPISGVGGFVFPGDRVDVLTTFQQGEVAITKTILQNVEVLAMNEQTTRPAPAGAAAPQATDQAGQATANGGEAPATIQVKSATLAVSPDQAQSLLLSAFKGAVHLALRPREDDSVVSLPGQTDWALVGMQAPTQEPPEKEEPPAQMPPGMWPGVYGPMGQMQQPPAVQPSAPSAGAAAQPEPAPTIEVFRGGEREVVTVD